MCRKKKFESSEMKRLQLLSDLKRIIILESMTILALAAILAWVLAAK